MNEIDLLELGSYTELQGGNIVLPSGYSSILVPLTDQIKKETIYTKCPVKKVYWKRKKTVTGLETVDEYSEGENSDDSQKTVTEAPNYRLTNESETTMVEDYYEYNPDYPLRGVCEDGRIFTAEHVICTIPLGVLKAAHKTMFDPELPLYKQEAINNLMFGTVNKIYLEYERPFLRSDISEIMLLWDNELNGDSTDVDRSTADFLSKNWHKKIYSFAKITDTLLLGWVSGREAEYMETLPNEIVAEKCTEILRNFMQDPYVPNPKKCVYTSWKTQPYTNGSYTSIPVGALQEDIENLAQPLYASSKSIKPAVVFAGEHTHSSFYSTVHGAFLSGRTAAQYLLATEEPDEIILESEGSDLSAWIQGISLE